MQDKFRVEAWRCYLCDELEAPRLGRSRQLFRVLANIWTNIHTILGKGWKTSPVVHS